MPASQASARARRDAVPTAGPAVLRLLRATIVAEWAELTGDVVTYRGRRRERDVRGVRLYPAHARSVRLRAGEWVEWVGAGRETAGS